MESTLPTTPKPRAPHTPPSSPPPGSRDNLRLAAEMAQAQSLGADHLKWLALAGALGDFQATDDGEKAARHLEIYAGAFVSRNGVHVNGDQSGLGHSSFTYRPFTVEGNFAAMQVVQEMLLQSWSPTPGTPDSEVLRIFPAVPAKWADASFSDLRAEGGHRVSAIRENNSTTFVKVVAGRDGTVRIRANFDDREPRWSVDDVVKFGNDFHLTMRRGEMVTATLEREPAFAGNTKEHQP